MSRVMVGIAAVVFGALVGESAIAARLLKCSIELDSQLVFKANYTDDGTATPETVWRYFAKRPGEPEVVRLEADPDNPLSLEVEGDLVIRMQHVDRTIVEAKASKLKLIRDDAANQQWYLPADEVERIAKLNQIAEPSPWEMTERQRLLSYLGGGVVVLVALAVIIAMAWRKSGRRQ